MIEKWRFNAFYKVILPRHLTIYITVLKALGFIEQTQQHTRENCDWNVTLQSFCDGFKGSHAKNSALMSGQIDVEEWQYASTPLFCVNFLHSMVHSGDVKLSGDIANHPMRLRVIARTAHLVNSGGKK